MPGIALPGNSDRTQADIIKDLERRLSALESQVRLRNATIDEPGSLQVRDSAGNILLYVGTQPDGRMGLTVRRNDGTAVMELAGFTGDPTYHQVLRIFDRSGNEVISDDEISGLGLANPQIPLTITKTADYQSTSAGSMTQLLELNFVKQHPRAFVSVVGYCDPGTAGEVDLYDALASTVKAGPQSVTATPSAFLLTCNVSGGWQTGQALRIRARVTSGAGAIHVLAANAYGVKS